MSFKQFPSLTNIISFLFEMHQNTWTQIFYYLQKQVLF